MHEFVEHYHAERNLRGLGNELIKRVPSAWSDGGISARQHFNGLPNYYC
jgi:hypothetical protein